MGRFDNNCADKSMMHLCESIDSIKVLSTYNKKDSKRIILYTCVALWEAIYSRDEESRNTKKKKNAPSKQLFGVATTTKIRSERARKSITTKQAVLSIRNLCTMGDLVPFANYFERWKKKKHTHTAAATTKTTTASKIYT